MNSESSILFLGDVVPYKQFKFKNSYKTIINLEAPIIEEAAPVRGKIILGVKENYLNDIFNSNLLGVSIGNNHILDFGVKGLDSTLKELERCGINYFGLVNPDENHNPLIVEFNNKRIALIAAICPSTSPVVEFDNIIHLSMLDADEIIRKVETIREMVHRIVLYVHWGVEESSYPSGEDVLTARKLIDAGVDIIIGSHAHAPQPVEKYRNGIIAYNLGNFIMPALKNSPSYYDEKGVPASSYNKRLMPWNRISWGVIIDMDTLEFELKKYMFLSNRIITLPFTHLDRYTELREDINGTSYGAVIEKHIKKREFQRKITDFIYNPHVPQILRRKI